MDDCSHHRNICIVCSDHMASVLPHLSTDQIAAFVELARQGQIRGTAGILGITEQGVRNRLLTLEAQLGVELYRKRRGPRRSTVLTDHGRRFLPHALAFLERAQELCRSVDLETGSHEIHVAASQYLTRYVLIDVLRRFRIEAPDIHVRVSTMNEREIEDAVQGDPDVAFGLAAPYESSPELAYHHLFTMGWHLICPRRHRLVARRRVGLDALRDEPFILYERGSTGRQHVLDAFHARQLAPRVALETTSTETIVSMVEAGLGVSIVPLLPSGVITRGRRVEVRAVSDTIRPIQSGVLLRRGDTPARSTARLIEFTRSRFAGAGGPGLHPP
jgi:DNA-binding transcriptional LysR family regulator